MQTGDFSITVTSTPACEAFLKLKYQDDTFLKLEDFISKHNDPTNDILEQCILWYRGNQETYSEYLNRISILSQELQLVRFNGWKLIVQPHIRAADYFTKKALDCLQNARIFAMKSAMVVDYNHNLPWKYGYLLQFSMRCTYFGTAATWYANTFDQILQIVYWAYQLYTSAIDRKHKAYDDSWPVKRIMACCDYDFVIKELNKRGCKDIQKLLTKCHGKTSQVRTWSNYIKHKGGIEYSYLEAKDPLEVYLIPITASDKRLPSEFSNKDRFAIHNFKSPIEIDIDQELTTIKDAHKALVECIIKIIEDIDFDKYQLKFE